MAVIQMAEVKQAIETRREAALMAIGNMLSGSRADAINYRASIGLDTQWAEDIDAYEGRDELTRSAESLMERIREYGEQGRMTEQNPAQPRSTAHPMIVRQKTNSWAARIGKLLFPLDTKNYAVGPTPVPELANALNMAPDAPWVENGQTLQHPNEQRPLTIGDLASEVMATARRAASGMEKEIEDCLVEAGYNATARRVIHDGAKVGVGILKGPVTENRKVPQWQRLKDKRTNQTVHARKAKLDQKPNTAHISFWDFFPDPDCGEDIHDGTFVWERDRIKARALLDLAKLPGYNEKAILRAYKEGPKPPIEAASYRRYGPHGMLMPWNTNRFEVWTYTGDLKRDDLIAAGVELIDRDGPEIVSAVVVMVNDIVIKADINPLDSGELPYDVFVWEPVEGSWAGIGIPRLMRSEARTFITAWRCMLDNAALSHAPMIIMKDKVTAADGNYTLYARKIWNAPNEGDVRDAFTIIDIPNHQAELQNIITLALKFADDGTALPQIAQGERGSAPDTVGGMTLLMNAANAVTERVVRIWDDNVTVPHITRYFEWLMQFSEKEDIKGDVQIWARGASALLLRDVQQQGLIQLMTLADNPKYAPYADPEKLWKAVVRNFQLDQDEVSRTSDEVTQFKQAESAKPPPENPTAAVARIRAEATLQAAKMQAAGQAQAQTIEAESERNNLELQRQKQEAENAHQLEVLELQRQLAILQYAMKREETLDKVKADLAKTAMMTNTQKELAAAAAVQQRTQQATEEMTA